MGMGSAVSELSIIELGNCAILHQAGSVVSLKLADHSWPFKVSTTKRRPMQNVLPACSSDAGLTLFARRQQAWSAPHFSENNENNQRLQLLTAQILCAIRTRSLRFPISDAAE
jgi:hypothetical protein